MNRDIKCCDFETQIKIKHEVLPVISQIWEQYLQLGYCYG